MKKSPIELFSTAKKSTLVKKTFSCIICHSFLCGSEGRYLWPFFSAVDGNQVIQTPCCPSYTQKKLPAIVGKKWVGTWNLEPWNLVWKLEKFQTLVTQKKLLAIIEKKSGTLEPGLKIGKVNLEFSLFHLQNIHINHFFLSIFSIIPNAKQPLPQSGYPTAMNVIAKWLC